MRIVCYLLLAALMVLPASGALADDWTAVKLRGAVLQLVGGDWQPLKRGDIVPDDRMVKTQSGRVTLVRGAETIDLGPNTQIQIFDRGGRRPFTTVREHFGTVSVEAEVKQVQHFAVQTPFLVAVVKGTKFTVRSGGTRSDVKVTRGAVQVEDDEGATEMVLAGQSAKVGADAPIQVRGVATTPPKAKDDKKDKKANTGARDKRGEKDQSERSASKDKKDESGKSAKEDKKEKSEKGGKEEKSEKAPKEEKSEKAPKEEKSSGAGESGHGDSDGGGKGKGKD